MIAPTIRARTRTIGQKRIARFRYSYSAGVGGSTCHILRGSNPPGPAPSFPRTCGGRVASTSMAVALRLGFAVGGWVIHRHDLVDHFLMITVEPVDLVATEG